MLKMRKVLSVALVVVMALSMMVMNSSAIESGKDFGFVVRSDKTAAEIVPGAEVTVTIAFEMSDFNQLMSDMRFAILYDSSVYTPDLSTRTWLNDWAGYAKEATKPSINAAFATTTMNNSTMSDEEKALYDSCVMQVASADAGLGITAKMGFNVTEEADGISVPEFSIKFNVTGDAAAIAAGNINIAMTDSSVSAAQYIKKTNGSSTPTVLAPATVSSAKANILANMPQVASSILQWSKAQIRFKGIAEGSTKADYKNTFDVRTVAKISQDDFIAKFGSDDAAKGAILDLGFVYMINGAEFDYDTAVEVANGGTADGYVKKSVTYIQHAADGADYVFTCLVAENPDSAQNDVLTCIAFVKTADETIVFDGPNVVDYSLLYALMPE